MKLKDEASQSTIHTLKCDAISRTGSLDGSIQVDLPPPVDVTKAIAELKFKNLEDIPGFPGPIPSLQRFPLGHGTFIEEMHRSRLELEQGWNLRPTPEDFDHFYEMWEQNNGAYQLYQRWSKDVQHQMLIGIIYKEHTTSEAYFN